MGCKLQGWTFRRAHHQAQLQFTIACQGSDRADSTLGYAENSEKGVHVLKTQGGRYTALRTERERGTLGPEREGYIHPFNLHEVGW